MGNLLLYNVLTLEACCSTLVVEPSFLHHLSSKWFNPADHKMANFVALVRSDDFHLLIESQFGVDLVVCYLDGKAKYLVLLSRSGFR